MIKRIKKITDFVCRRCPYRFSEKVYEKKPRECPKCGGIADPVVYKKK
jgi:DNA-directed RNA polymerase subunit RPC12/RpoP